MKNLLLLAIVFSFLQIKAQDTTRVQTFTFDDISKRRGWFEFPDDDTSYRKIMMNYTLKCDGATQQDNYACGEWDYTTYTDLYSYENVGTPYFLLGAQSLDSIPYLLTPVYDQYQYEQSNATYGISIEETESAWGLDEADTEETFRPDRMNHRAQYIYTAAELALSANPIDKMALNIVSSDADVEWLTIRLAHTDLTELTEGEVIDDGLQTAYQYNTAFSPGWQTLNFPFPFDYDGTSNLLVDITMHSGDPMGTATAIRGSDSGASTGLFSAAADRHLDFVGDQYVEVPASVFASLDQEVTISLWAYGDEESMPFNTWGFEGVDALNRRVLNVHLPWSNSRVYWDAGNEMSNDYDRIDVEVGIDDLAGKWTHWAFTKNATTGEMAMYMNGELIQSGTGKTRAMTGITRFKIAGKATTAFEGDYDGSMDEFRVWDKALTQEEISAYMNESVGTDHPQYASLQAAYDFNETDGVVAQDYSGNSSDAMLVGVPTRVTRDAATMTMNMVSTSIRPDIRFYQLSGTPAIDTTLLTESVAHPLYSVIESMTSIDQTQPGLEYTYIDTNYVYLPGYAFTYDIDGNPIDSMAVEATDTFFNSLKQNRHQLQNYVTPYGIGLSLGPDGFRWQYEVTDYSLLLNGLVEIAAGNQQELIDLEFEMIEGTPPRDLLAYETIWLGDYQHTDIADDVVMPAVNRTFSADASDFMLRTRTTGHWFGGFNNCAEFCPKNFNIKIDGNQEFEWLNWKECADNPVIDQGGTWIYDRAGWCPGTFADSYDHEITPFVTPGSTHSIDFGMQAYPNGGGDGNYRTTLQLFQYGPKHFQYDVEVTDIISPNTWEFHNRYNPICTDPEIEIRNLGAETVTSMDITFWVEGGTPETYNWTGNLEFNQRQSVVLPISSQSFWSGALGTVFHVSVSAPNGMDDEYAANDEMKSDFEFPVLVNQDFFILFRSNSAANETTYSISDSQGNVVFLKDDFEPNTIYRDTLYLPDDCYVLRVNDSGGDGLSFFANNDGNGYCLLKNVSGSTIKNFNANFGSFIEYHFILDKTVGVEENMDESLIRISPNPSNGLFTLSIDGYYGSEVNLEILDARGATVRSLINIGSGNLVQQELDLSDMAEGIYFARILIDGRQVVRRLIKE